METVPAISVSGLSHRYGDRVALDDLSFTVGQGEVFAFLGPNGGGKTTLFRVLSTLIPCQRGAVTILGFDLRESVHSIRQRMGVVFQAPSLDKKLTVRENLRHHAALYGLRGKLLREREWEVLEQLGLADRANERTEQLSGGLRRRTELAKGLLHHPQLLLLDEPSTGLDPGARLDMWRYLTRLRDEFQVTIVLTTHLLDEADRADRLAILHAGRLVALDSPDALRRSVGGDAITIKTDEPQRLIEAIQQRFQQPASLVDGWVRLESRGGADLLAQLVAAFPQHIQSITLGKPTLEDVFIDKTGHRFWQTMNHDG